MLQDLFHRSSEPLGEVSEVCEALNAIAIAV
jgi:hypothetical protein